MPYKWHWEYERRYVSWVPWGWITWIKSVYNCNYEDRSSIEYAFDHVSLITIPRLRAMGGECVTLATCLAGKTTTTVDIDCRNSLCDDYYMNGIRYATRGAIPPGSTTEISMCGLALPPNVQQITNRTVFHELVHLCGGNELDCYILENYLYSSFYPGPTIPVPALYILEIMCRSGDNWLGLKAGKFMAWNPSTGEVWVKVKVGSGTGSGFGLLPAIWGANNAWSMPGGCP